MTAQILDGKATAAAIKADLTTRVARLAEHGVRPGLGTVLIGDDPGSQSYVAGKHRDCEQVGIASIREHHPADITQEFLEERITALNEDPACTGFIVQLPLPRAPRLQRAPSSSSTRPRTPTACTRSTSAGSCSWPTRRCPARRAASSSSSRVRHRSSTAPRSAWSVAASPSGVRSGCC